ADLPDPVTQAQRELHPLLVPGADEPGAPVVPHEVLDPLRGGAQGSSERVAVEVGDEALGRQELLPAGGQRIGGVEVGGAGVRVAHAPISVRTAKSSGKKVRSRAFCRKPTPELPPVPRFMPMMRWTVLRWRKRHSWKLSSRSTSSSQAS